MALSEELKSIEDFAASRLDEDSIRVRGWTNNVRDYEWDKKGIWQGAGFSTAVIHQFAHDVKFLLAEIQRLSASQIVWQPVEPKESGKEFLAALLYGGKVEIFDVIHYELDGETGEDGDGWYLNYGEKVPDHAEVIRIAELPAFPKEFTQKEKQQ